MKLSDFIEGCERVSKFTDEVCIHTLISDLKIINESQKAKVPNFIGDWIFKAQLVNDFSLCVALEYATIKLYAKNSEEILKWLEIRENQETFALAWINGYTVEKEPKYTVKIKATKQYLSNDEIGPHFDPSFRSNFTKSDLEKLGLGWVFDCEGMEVDKVGK